MSRGICSLDWGLKLNLTSVSPGLPNPGALFSVPAFHRKRRAALRCANCDLHLLSRAPLPASWSGLLISEPSRSVSAFCCWAGFQRPFVGSNQHSCDRVAGLYHKSGFATLWSLSARAEKGGELRVVSAASSFATVTRPNSLGDRSGVFLEPGGQCFPRANNKDKADGYTSALSRRTVPGPRWSHNAS